MMTCDGKGVIGNGLVGPSENGAEQKKETKNLRKNKKSYGKTRILKDEILAILRQQGVAYDRELRYRLESRFSHDEVGKALKQLEKEKKIKRTGVRGRRGPGTMPNVFYRLPGTPYSRIEPIMRKKLDLSTFIAGVSREMGRHAELVWWMAFKRNAWDLYPKNVSEVGSGIREFRGRTTTVNNDIDFIAIKDQIAYGVEIKNGLMYPNDLYWKIRVAAELGLIPMIIARWLNPAQVKCIREVGGEFVVYKDAIYSTTYAPLISQVRELLGFPIEARDEIDDEYFRRKVEAIHRRVLEEEEKYRRKLKEFLSQKMNDPYIRRCLGTGGR